ncbi:transposase [Flammeovirga sp. SJP92]|uniref:transposase n=1 Tax=Flammeovirga sp. SJP92 TaxID=1775430 RepID=UPI00078927E8|nr:transposase [Flammeovirga sp. SJP92]KXX69543.1 hypothetical protein AVL50_15845 [Flammeovirga sp. SJP92]
MNNKEDENKILIETDYHSLKHSENWHSKISPPKNSIPSIIRSYKSSVKRYCNRFDLQFEWQKRYYDHIIRDGKDYLRIENYILNNRNKWDEDRFHP